MVTFGILSVVCFRTSGGVRAVTGEVTRWGGEFLELLGMDLSGCSYYQRQNLSDTPLARTDRVMLIGMFMSYLVAALLASRVRFRLFTSNIRIFRAIIGGILSDYGARLAFRYNLANFFTNLPYFSLHVRFLGVFMVLGIYLDIKLCNTSFFRPKAELQCASKENIPLLKQNSRAKFHLVLGSILFITPLTWVFYLVLISGSIST